MSSLVTVIGGLIQSKQRTTYCERSSLNFHCRNVALPTVVPPNTNVYMQRQRGHWWASLLPSWIYFNCSLWRYYCNRGNVCQYGSECVKSSVSNNATMRCPQTSLRGLIPDHDDVSKHGTTLKLWTSEREPILIVNNNTHNEHEFKNQHPYSRK